MLTHPCAALADCCHCCFFEVCWGELWCGRGIGARGRGEWESPLDFFALKLEDGELFWRGWFLWPCGFGELAGKEWGFMRNEEGNFSRWDFFGWVRLWDGMERLEIRGEREWVSWAKLWWVEAWVREDDSLVLEVLGNILVFWCWISSGLRGGLVALGLVKDWPVWPGFSNWDWGIDTVGSNDKEKVVCGFPFCCSNLTRPFPSSSLVLTSLLMWERFAGLAWLVGQGGCFGVNSLVDLRGGTLWVLYFELLFLDLELCGGFLWWCWWCSSYLLTRALDRQDALCLAGLEQPLHSFPTLWHGIYPFAKGPFSFLLVLVLWGLDLITFDPKTFGCPLRLTRKGLRNPWRPATLRSTAAAPGTTFTRVVLLLPWLWAPAFDLLENPFFLDPWVTWCVSQPVLASSRKGVFCFAPKSTFAPALPPLRTSSAFPGPLCTLLRSASGLLASQSVPSHPYAKSSLPLLPSPLTRPTGGAGSHSEAAMRAAFLQTKAGGSL